jgi:hypothetical protein
MADMTGPRTRIMTGPHMADMTGPRTRIMQGPWITACLLIPPAMPPIRRKDRSTARSYRKTPGAQG